MQSMRVHKLKMLNDLCVFIHLIGGVRLQHVIIPVYTCIKHTPLIGAPAPIPCISSAARWGRSL